MLPRYAFNMMSGVATGKNEMTMINLKRRNLFYDTLRFGQPEIRVHHKKGKGKKSPRYLLRCGCCEQKLQVYYADDGLEIGGVNGTIDDWREILLPLLLIGQSGNRFVNVKRKEKSANKTSQRIARVRKR